MRPDVFQLIGYGSLALLVVYFVFYALRMRSAPKKPQAALKDVSNANTEALRENSELLRELIAINRKLLEKQEQRDA